VVEKPHRETFKGGNREWKFVPTQVKFRNAKNKQDKTDEERAARVRGLLEKERERRNRLKELGIDYEFSGYVSHTSFSLQTPFNTSFYFSKASLTQS
jgi:nucleolar protein 15